MTAEGVRYKRFYPVVLLRFQKDSRQFSVNMANVWANILILVFAHFVGEWHLKLKRRTRRDRTQKT